MTVTKKQSTITWAGVYGDAVRLPGFTELLNLNTSVASVQRKDLFFDCIKDGSDREVYISLNNNLSFDDSITAGNPKMLDDFMRKDPNTTDSANGTFTGRINVSVGLATISNVPAIYTYKFDGQNNIYFPKAQVVVINPDNPDINLLSPAYEESVSTRGGVRMRWDSLSFSRRQVLEISSDATFPEGATLKVNTGAARNRNLSRNELSQVEDMSVLSGEGGVYWRVRGKDVSGKEGTSQTFFMSVQQ